MTSNKKIKKAKRRLDAALSLLQNYLLADSLNIAAMGYCFDGSLLLNAARLGENVKAVVSFHGSPIGSFHGNTAAGSHLEKNFFMRKYWSVMELPTNTFR